MKKTGKIAVKVGKLHLKLALLPATLLIKYVASPALKLALTPLRNSINTIVSRRAKKLAWSNRKSSAPTPAETLEAKKWTQTRLKSKGPHGRLIAAAAGFKASTFKDGMLGTSAGQLGLEPATTAIIIASVPVAVAIVNATARKLDKPDDAPRDPRAGAPSPEEQAAAEAEYKRLTEADAEADSAAGLAGKWAKLPMWAKIAIPASGVLVIGGTIYLIARPSSDTTVVAGGWGGYAAR